MASAFWKKNTCTKRVIMVYTFFIAFATVAEAMLGWDSIYQIDYSDRPDRLSRLVLHVVLQTTHFGMCLYWIYAARIDYIPGLSFAYSAMLIRTCGNVIYTAGVAVYEMFILPRTVVNVIKIASWIPTELRIWYQVFWLVIEVYVLGSLYSYHQSLNSALQSSVENPAEVEEPEVEPGSPISPYDSSECGSQKETRAR